MFALQRSRLVRHRWWNGYTAQQFIYIKLVIQVWSVVLLWSWMVDMLSFSGLDWKDMDGEILMHVRKLVGQQVGTSEV